MSHEYATPEQDAIAFVDRYYSDDAIITPHYTRSALMQMGWQLGKGAPLRYRQRYTAAFVDAWITRYEALTGLKVI